MRKTKTIALLLAIMLGTFFSSAQEVLVSGTVKDKSGSPLPGVNVVNKGTTVGVVTDANGNFRIRVSDANATLVFSFIGYKTVEQSVSGRTTVDVVMEEETTELDEVVVVGYGVQKKKLVSGSTINVGGETIQTLRTNSPMDALKGITPGVSIVQNNGLPGSGSKVVIRGIGTNGNAKPLYVVDGVVVGDIDFLSPSDIESIDVLKDAATSAIYGSRAANGVILVTTKTGKKDTKPTITYDGYYGWANVYKKPVLLNAKQYMEIYDEAQVNSGIKPTQWDKVLPSYIYDSIMSGKWNGTNWLEEIINKNAPVQSHSVNVTGNTKKTTYSLGGSYYSEEGILGKDNQTNNLYERVTVRMNTSYVLWDKGDRDILVVGENLSFSKFKKPAFRQGNIYWNDLHNMLVTSPLLPMYDSTGNYHKATTWNADEVNPIALMEYNEKYNYNSNNSIVASGYADFSPIKGLNIKSQYGINNWYGSWRQWIPAYELGPKTISTRDQVTQGMYNGLSWVWTNTATYSNRIDDFSFTALLGHEMTRTSENLSLQGHNENSLFNAPEYAYLKNVPVIDPAYTTLTGKDEYGHAILSYFGRISLDYKETYMLTAVFRADGSSNFAEGNRWGTFPSVSAGWVISNMSFMEWSKSVVNTLKLRVSWGQNGNEAITPFQYLALIAYDNSDDYFFGTDKTARTVGSRPAYVPNPNVTWETSEQLNIGMDLYMLKNKLSLTFDYYDKNTRDWLVVPPALAAWGTNPPYSNGGTVNNRGFEMSFGWNDQAGDLKYGISVSLAYNKNEVTKLNSSDSILHGQPNVLSQGTAEMYRAQVGYPMGYFYGFKTDGVFQDSAEVEAFTRGKSIYYTLDKKTNKLVNKIKPGDQRFVDMNGDTIIDDKDKVMIGDPNPHYILGLQLNLEYKGFYAQAIANGAFGMQVAKSYRSFVDGAKQNYTIDVYERWHGPGTSNKMPRLTAVASNKISDIYIHDADYLRISNITVGYNLKYLIKALPMSEFKVYFAVKNLKTFTKYNGMDPEVGYGPDSWSSGIDLGLYPSSTSYMLGLSVKF
ncbi:MAG: TonB-dependent receptor [Bacteroidales bacterium]|nr:TonB-dependent receptor [Bacteroidales bacterium]